MEDTLPPLRQELRLEAGATRPDGSVAWMLHDPVQHSHFELDPLDIALLARWTTGGCERLLAQCRADPALPPTEVLRPHLHGLLAFLTEHRLLRAEGAEAARALATRQLASRLTPWQWLLRHHLSLRLPLVQPADVLQRTLPAVAWLGHRAAHRVWAALTLLGLLLVLQQWDAFLGTAPEFFTPGGLLLMAVTLSATKVLHELGHAYTATTFGCRVSSMGVNLMLGVPMLYTDTSSAWRLAERSQRMWIDAAGVLVETGVAGLATLAWTLLPDGPLRSVAFALATSIWLLTLVVNLNPFARFDGYYFLSDWLGMPNLQPRAFALAQWWIEHTLLGHQAAPPEVVSPRRLTGLVVFAALTWLYRLVLALGVALLVYHLFFKALGVALLVLEVWMLLLKPVALWVRQGIPRGLWRGTTTRRRLLTSGALLLALLGLPLDRHVEAPAVLAPTRHTPVHAPEPARIEQVLVRDGQQVEAGTLLLRLSAPDLAVDDTRARITQLLQGERLDRGVADATDRGQRTVFEEQWQESAATLQALAQRRAALELRAQHAGTVTDLDATLRPGRWVAPEQQLARIVDTRHGAVQGFVPQSDAWRLPRNAAARFIADDPARPALPLRLTSVAEAASEHIDLRLLASPHGGPISARSDAQSRAVPMVAQRRVGLALTEAADTPTDAVQRRGLVVIEAEGVSLAGEMGRRLRQLLFDELVH